VSLSATILTRLRRFRPFWTLYNVAHYRQLRGNSNLYRELGIRKSVVRPVAHRDIRHAAAEPPWLDSRGAADALASDPRLTSFPEDIRAALARWVDDGLVVLDRFFAEELVDEINADVERLLTEGELTRHFRDPRVMDSAQRSEPVRRAVHDLDLMRVLGFLMGREVTLFRTINFIEGSQQAPHSDSFHMTTEPKGYLVAIWVALEDIKPDSGPVVYYPGSHRLPYVMTEDLAGGNGRGLFIDEGKDRRYEAKIAEILAQGGIEPVDFLPRKGDVMVWHANLLHGGKAISRPGATRRSLVAHYFAKGVLCYHEVTERPAIVPSD
jgi:ectoine hydroxylase